MGTKHTPGPWQWEFNSDHKNLHLVGGHPQFDLTIIDFDRWGMNKATMRLRDTNHDGMNLLYRVHERPDWIMPEKGREHHKRWHQIVIHPDARLIASAPDLLEALESLIYSFESDLSGMDEESISDELCQSLNKARAAIKKATE